MRKLATVRRISAVNPIPDADAIEVATVDGWQVVIKKGEFSPGDLAVYFEVDSWVPYAIAPFLARSQAPREFDGVPGERLRTVKLRGQISQGLLLPVSILPNAETRQAGEDVSGELNVLKYEPPIPAQLAGIVRGVWPSCVPKTDQERCQNLSDQWTRLTGLRYEVTEKLEGSSMTVGFVEGEFLVCSRNTNLVESERNSFWRMARHYDIERRLREEGLEHLVLQGEIIGEGVQGNHYGIRGQDFYVFDVLDTRTGQYVMPEVRRNLVAQLGLRHVPVVAEDRALQGMTVAEVLAWADGASVLNPARLREGLVFKQVDGVEHWKAVSNRYLLKTGG